MMDVLEGPSGEPRALTPEEGRSELSYAGVGVTVGVSSSESSSGREVDLLRPRGVRSPAYTFIKNKNTWNQLLSTSLRTTLICVQNTVNPPRSSATSEWPSSESDTALQCLLLSELKRKRFKGLSQHLLMKSYSD